MEAHLCNHPKVPHAVEYKVGEAVATVSRDFENLEDADIFAQKIIRQNPGRLRWLKIYRSDNSRYSCFFWENPEKERDMASTQKVQLEVDMEPLASTFENIGIGFKEQGKSIRLLWGMQSAIGILIAGDIIARIIS